MVCGALGCGDPPPDCPRQPGSRGSTGARRRVRRGESLDPARVAGLPLFDGLPLAAVASLLAEADVLVVPRRTLLFSAGEEADRFYLLLEGRIKLAASTATGGDSVVDICEPVSSFAEAAMFGSGYFPLSAEVIDQAELVQVPAGPFLRALRRDRSLAFSMMTSLSHWSRKLAGELARLKVQTPLQRVGCYFLSLTELTEGDTTVTLPITKALLASRLGIEPESFSRVLTRLRGVGIEPEGDRIHIHDVARLRGLCGAAAGSAGFPE